MARIVLEDGEVFGTLCALDSDKVEVSQAQQAVLNTLAKLVARAFDERRHKHQLADALHKLNDLAESREQLVERIVGDLSEPLRDIAGLARLLRVHDVQGAALRGTATMIETHAARIDTLLRSLAVVESSRGDEPADIPISELFEDVVGAGRALVAPEVKIEATGVGTVYASRDLLFRLVTTLMLGAATRSESGIIRLRGEPSNGVYVIELTDSGRALTDEESDQLAAGTAIGGTEDTKNSPGLPAALARHLAGSLGAQLIVGSSGREGTRVGILLPIPDLGQRSR